MEQEKWATEEIELCQSLYWSLLEMCDKKENKKASFFIRALWATEKCDNLINLKKVRHKFSRFLDGNVKGCMVRIMSYKPTQMDNDNAMQALLHYNDWTKKRIEKGLSFWNYLYFKTIYTRK